MLKLLLSKKNRVVYVTVVTIEQKMCVFSVEKKRVYIKR